MKFINIKNFQVSVLIYIFLILVLVVSMFPISWAVLCSLKTNPEIIRHPYSFPKQIQWDNFIRAWKIGRFSIYTINSIIITLFTVSLVVTLATITGFALAKLKLYKANVILLLFLLGLMVPFHGYMIPMYYNLGNLGLLNSRLGAILAMTATQLPLAVYLIRISFVEFPEEIMDSIRIDGGSPIQMLMYIVVPILKPALMSIIVISTIISWNEFIIPLFVLVKDPVRTLPIGLSFFQSRTPEINLTAAGTIMASLPLIMFYLVFQRHFIRGVLAGSLKE